MKCGFTQLVITAIISFGCGPIIFWGGRLSLTSQLGTQRSRLQAIALIVLFPDCPLCWPGVLHFYNKSISKNNVERWTMKSYCSRLCNLKYICYTFETLDCNISGIPLLKCLVFNTLFYLWLQLKYASTGCLLSN